jgi:hypothetical protein
MAPPANNSRRRHREVLFWSALALTLAPLLVVLPEGRVGLRMMPWLVLPPSCPSRELFDVDCPGCGLTRSFVFMSEGNWAASLDCHRLGWLLMGIAALQIPYRLHMLYGSGRFALSRRAAGLISTGLISLLILNWAVGFLRLF